METKICKKCGKEKPLTDFYFNFIYKDNYMPICKECHRLNSKKQYREKKEKFLNETKNN